MLYLILYVHHSKLSFQAYKINPDVSGEVVYICTHYFQSEHIGINMYDLVLDEDHEDVRQRISEADDRSVKRKTKHG